MAQAGDIKLNVDLSALRRLALSLEFTAERNRQISVEGWTPEHDDRHDHGELAAAAACYAAGNDDLVNVATNTDVWPQRFDYKPKDRRRDLIRAGALILAELERMDRAGG
jgi:hypothetical protein